MNSLIKLVPELGRSNVRVRDPAHVEAALRTMMKDAHHKLQVVADFDATLSKYKENGTPCHTTHAVLEESSLMPASYKEKARQLKDTYMPIEFDHTLTREEKIPKMVEWWTHGHALFLACEMTKDKLTSMVAESRARLRDGCAKFFDILHEMEIPLLIFSAGIGDVILETISQQARFHGTTMRLVSNMLEYDPRGKMVGFQGDMIHTFNKNEHAIHSGDYFHNIRHRENLLLLGDSLGDLGMADGATHVDCALRIGFLNLKVEDNLPVYMDNFDLVIVEDETLDVVNAILGLVLGR